MSLSRIVLIVALFVAGVSAKDINVVIFLTDKAKFGSAFIITGGLQRTLEKGEKADIELVLGGSSVGIFSGTSKEDLKMKEQINELVAMPNIRIVACSGAMKRQGVDAKFLSDGVKVVKAAPREVVLRQLDGYAVLQP